MSGSNAATEQTSRLRSKNLSEAREDSLAGRESAGAHWTLQLEMPLIGTTAIDCRWDGC